MDYIEHLALTGKPWLPSQKTFQTWHDDGMRKVVRGTRLLWLPPYVVNGRPRVDWKARVEDDSRTTLVNTIPLPEPGVYTVIDTALPLEQKGSGGWPMYGIRYLPDGWAEPVTLWVYWYDMNVVNYDRMTQQDSEYYLEILCRGVPEWEAQRYVLKELHAAYITSIATEHEHLIRVVDTLYYTGWETECPVTRVMVLQLCSEALEKWKTAHGTVRPLDALDVRAWKSVQSRVVRKLHKELHRRL